MWRRVLHGRASRGGGEVVFHGGNREKEANNRGKDARAWNLIHRVEHDEVPATNEVLTDSTCNGGTHGRHRGANHGAEKMSWSRRRTAEEEGKRQRAGAGRVSETA
jgi:hypothetical protein